MVEEYAREFEQLQIKCALRQELEQTTVRFLKGLNHTILDKVELQLFWTFEDACKLPVKVKKQLKSSKSHATILLKANVPFKPFNSYKIGQPYKVDSDKGKRK